MSAVVETQTEAATKVSEAAAAIEAATTALADATILAENGDPQKILD